MLNFHCEDTGSLLERGREEDDILSWEIVRFSMNEDLKGKHMNTEYALKDGLPTAFNQVSVSCLRSHD